MKHLAVVSLAMIAFAAASADAQTCNAPELICKAAANQETVKLTRQRLGDMEEFMAVTNKVFQQFVGNAKSGLSRVVRVLLKAL